MGETIPSDAPLVLGYSRNPRKIDPAFTDAPSETVAFLERVLAGHRSGSSVSVPVKLSKGRRIDVSKRKRRP